MNALRTEQNFKIHCTVSIFVIFLGLIMHLSPLEWLFVLLSIASMLSLELMNSAIERAVDLVTKEIHPLAKLAKDFAAGAVLVQAIFVIIVGLIIFLPKIVKLVL